MPQAIPSAYDAETEGAQEEEVGEGKENIAEVEEEGKKKVAEVEKGGEEKTDGGGRGRK
jgi:hypothetical protein